MQLRQLGHDGPLVSAIGLGCMGMSEFYGQANPQDCRNTILTALENGITMFDTADMYGSGRNEELIGTTLKQWPGEVLVATKFGIVRQEGRYERTISGRPEYVKQACEASLRRLQRDVIDLYYIHRVDTSIPIEDTIGAMADLIAEGKIKYIGISEASAATLQRAHAVHPLAAAQYEYSLWTRQIEKAVLPAARGLGISIVAYSPLGRGFLTGELDMSKIEEGDFRRMLPRLQRENYQHNSALLKQLYGIAERKGVRLSQLALAWVLAKGNDIIPIPGTTNMNHLMENVRASELLLTGEEVDALEAAVPAVLIRGGRYPEAGMAGIDG